MARVPPVLPRVRSRVTRSRNALLVLPSTWVPALALADMPRIWPDSREGQHSGSRSCRVGTPNVSRIVTLAAGPKWFARRSEPKADSYRQISNVNDSARRDAREAAAVTDAALALAGHKIDRYTYELTAKMGRGELAGDQAVEAILNRFVRTSRST